MPAGSKIGSCSSTPPKRGAPSHFVTYTLPSHIPPNTQTIPTVTTIEYLGIVLNTRLSAQDNVVSGANKARRMLFYLRRSFTILAPSIFILLYKAFIRPHLKYATQASSHILSRDGQVLERVQNLSLKFIKRLRHAPYETTLHWLRLFSLVRRRIRGDLICMYKLMHGLLDFPCAAVFAAPTRIRLRYHAFKIHQQRCKTRHRQHAFSVRVVSDWNKRFIRGDI